MMPYEIFIYVSVFVIGLCFGSFLNVVADRLYFKKPIVRARSMCFFCKAKLEVLDLIPLLSYFLLRGKCRYCEGRLSFFYPISELLTGAGFVALVFFSGVLKDASLLNIVYATYLLSVFCMFMVIFLSDAKYQIIPDKIVFPAIVLSLGYAVFETSFRLWSLYRRLSVDDFGKYLLKVGYFKSQLTFSLQGLGYTFLGALGIYAFLLFLVYITKGRGMGRGDVKLGFLIGIFNGFPLGILAIFIGFLSGAVYGVVLIVLRKKKMKDVIPFGPFLVFGSLIALFFGNFLLGSYLGIL